MGIIKTPDQRVRVFISSTINELADERKAAREAISNLRLIPVYFEAGARPHPPRDLYSAYLDQSHIFLGIYWNSYGWVAPGAQISGLEDEYRLCGNRKPKLIYVKRSTDRQARLMDLLADIEKSETACYQTFSDADELQRLIENDLSILLSETFENALSNRSSTGMDEDRLLGSAPRRFEEIPHLRSEIYGREEDLRSLENLFAKPGVNLITLLGAGGTGKTTLSIHLGHRLNQKFRDGLVFVPLAPVTDHRLIGTTIAGILSLQDSGKQAIEQTLIDFLSDKKLLLILDNFEQVVEGSRLLSELLTHCKDIKLLVTCRTSLHIRNERIYHLAPLALPDSKQALSLEALRTFPATQLFVERALEVNPRLQFSPENTAAILDICQRMDGLPLAIELTAARTKFFQPAALMSRIEKSLDLVSKGQKDLPERQQTLRAAIEWSYDLLSAETKKVFRQLGIFKQSWTMEAMDAILNTESEEVDVEEMTERLLDISLIKPVMISHSAEPRFNMLQTVHEYALERLEESPEARETKLRYAQYYLDLCIASSVHTWGANAESWLDKLEYENQNIRSSFYILLECQAYEKAWDLFYGMFQYWNIRGGFSEGLKWMQDAGITDPVRQQSPSISAATRGRTLTWAALVRLMLMQIEEGYALLHTAEQVLENGADDLSYAYAICFDGCYGVFLGFADAAEKVEKGFALAEKLQDPLLFTMLYLWSYEHFRQQGKHDQIASHFTKAKSLAAEHGFTYILGALYIQQFSLEVMNAGNDWTKTAENALYMFRLFPEKGYKGLKSAAMNAYALAMLMLDKPDEAHSPFVKALELARESGEKESEFYGILLAVGYLKKKGNIDKAIKLMGALDSFIETTHYPMIGSAGHQYHLAKSGLEQALEDPRNKNQYEGGKKMRIEEAVLFALSA